MFFFLFLDWQKESRDRMDEKRIEVKNTNVNANWNFFTGITHNKIVCNVTFPVFLFEKTINNKQKNKDKLRKTSNAGPL